MVKSFEGGAPQPDSPGIKMTEAQIQKQMEKRTNEIAYPTEDRKNIPDSARMNFDDLLVEKPKVKKKRVAPTTARPLQGPKIDVGAINREAEAKAKAEKEAKAAALRKANTTDMSDFDIAA